MKPSTKNVSALAGISDLKRLTQSMALLDAIISPDWDGRYYSYNSRWGEREEMASMRDGCGDHWFLLFGDFGAAIKGLSHESEVARDRRLPELIQKSLPPEFSSFLKESAFGMNEVSFCFWRCSLDTVWSVVLLPETKGDLREDGSERLLELLDGDPVSYQIWAQNYFERDVPLEVVKSIYAHRPISQELITSLNADINLTDLKADLLEIGYGC